jgi:hypothetical protein
MSEMGLARRGLECQHCQEPFALSEIGIMSRHDVEKLPDPFPAECPQCHFEATYPKSSIAILVAVGRQ